MGPTYPLLLSDPIYRSKEAAVTAELEIIKTTAKSVSLFLFIPSPFNRFLVCTEKLTMRTFL